MLTKEELILVNDLKKKLSKFSDDNLESYLVYFNIYGGLSRLERVKINMLGVRYIVENGVTDKIIH